MNLPFEERVKQFFEFYQKFGNQKHDSLSHESDELIIIVRRYRKEPEPHTLYKD